jgi:hypothetical protein
MKSLGKIAYEAYFGFSKGLSLVSGAPLPAWEGQKAEIHAAWEAAADAVTLELSKRVIS